MPRIKVRHPTLKTPRTRSPNKRTADPLGYNHTLHLIAHRVAARMSIISNKPERAEKLAADDFSQAVVALWFSSKGDI